MAGSKPEIDVNVKFVREIERRADGLVSFEFAIGDPDLFVEMLLPAEAYAAFCHEQAVSRLPPREVAPADAGTDWQWRLHEATHQRFR